ncbi:MAG: CVNH domain-containing protein [Thermoanaerobaculia bacterium]
MKKSLFVIAVLLLVSTSAFAQASSFQGTCSNYTVQYSGSSAVLQATCLTAAGAGHATSLTLQGIGNSNGSLVKISGAATFQQSCGSIVVSGNASGATLSALCRTGGGGLNATSIALTGIKNNNGNLSY